MLSRIRYRWLPGTLGILLIGGCCSPLAEHLKGPPSHHVNVANDPGRNRLPPAPKQEAVVLGASLQAPHPVDEGVQHAVLQVPQPEQPKTKLSQLEKLLILPREIPGATTPNIELPSPREPEKRAAAVNLYFPTLPLLPRIDPGQPGPEGRPLTLADLQKLAAEHSPLIRQAAANVAAARGNAEQVGLPPNPTVGFEGDSMNQAATAGILGGFIDQVIVTAGKLRVAQEAALMDVRNNEQRLRKAEADLRTDVRRDYFAFLWARENLRVTIGVAHLTDQLYNVLLQMLRAGVVAPYEVMQLRVVALQTRGNEVTARIRYRAAWQQLAATLSQPGLPLTEIEGQIDRPLPLFHQEDVLARLFAEHTDILIARYTVVQNQLQLRLAQLQPVPNVEVRAMVQHDYTTPPFHGITSVAVSVPLPVWNRNQGAIRQAEAQLAGSTQEEQRVRNDLARRSADAFERYDNNRTLLELYRRQVLPAQVLAFRGISERYAKSGDPARDGINYNDLVTAEQALVTAVQTYLSVLRDQWQAVTDIGGLLQTPDLFGSGEELPVAPVPALESLGPCPR